MFGNVSIVLVFGNVLYAVSSVPIISRRGREMNALLVVYIVVYIYYSVF